MNILNNITIKSLKLNKKRTLVTIVGILLSTALICAVAGMVSSFQKTLLHATKQTDGDYHVTFKNVPFEELKYIENNPKIEYSFKDTNIGYAKLENEEEYRQYIYVKGFDQTALHKYGIRLVKGELPKNSEEILISENQYEYNKKEYEVGNQITLNVGKRINKNGEELTQEDSSDNLDEEKIIDTSKHTYKIVGIMKQPNNAIEPYTSIGSTAITYLDSNTTLYNISVKYHHSKDYEETTKLINHSKKIMEDGKYKIHVNSELLRWEGSGFGDAIMKTLYILSGIVISIIIVTSIIVIKNSFSISITERFKQYGMLSSVGATSKQIKRNVIFEGFILGIIAIPLGILAGLVAVFILIQIMNLLLKDMLNDLTFLYGVSYIAIIGSILLSGITIFLSSIIPAKKAAKISPIEAIRGNNEIKIKAKKLKTPKIIKKLFKVEGEIALKNLKRSRKKYRTTVISIVISIVIFIALSSIITFGFKGANIYYQQLNYNLSITDSSRNVSDKENYEKYKALVYREKDITYSISRLTPFSVSKEKYIRTDLLYDNIENEKEAEIYIVSLGKEEYERLLKKAKGNKIDLKNKGILIDDTLISRKGKYKQGNIVKVKEGDIVSGKLHLDGKNKDYNIEIGLRTEERPMGFESTYATQPIIIVSEEAFNDLEYYFVNSLHINSKNSSKTEKALQSKIEKNKDYYGNIHINNFDEIKRQNNSMILMVAIFLYGFIAVITLIGVTNIFNTITTNMALRSKEFAILKSIGMTETEFKRMICLESLFYGIKSLLIGIPIGIICSYFIYKGLGSSMEMHYIFPTTSICICIVFVMLIIFMTMIYSMKKINKQNIIETIRNENI